MNILNSKYQRAQKGTVSSAEIDVLDTEKEAILISLHPKHLEQIMLGHKKLEFRRRWTKFQPRKIVIYATAPIKKIVAIADIKNLHNDSIEKLWDLSESIGGGLKKQELFEYFKGCESGYAIEFENINQLLPPIEPKAVFEKFSPPQSFRFLSKSELERLTTRPKANADLIFISGAHGVGKSHLCAKASSSLGVRSYSASKLIKQFPANNKKTSSIDENQSLLINSLKKLSSIKSPLLLDGHFVLLDIDNRVTEIPEQTFRDINPSQIILITDSPEAILERNVARGITDFSLKTINELQSKEILHAKRVAKSLHIPIIIIKSGDENIFITTISNIIFNQG
jgi:predicted transcriptional regulator/adenylate kinase